MTNGFSWPFSFVGRRYDSDGELNDWWTSSSAAAFDRHSECFVDQYNQFQVGTSHVSIWSIFYWDSYQLSVIATLCISSLYFCNRMRRLGEYMLHHGMIRHSTIRHLPIPALWNPNIWWNGYVAEIWWIKSPLKSHEQVTVSMFSICTTARLPIF